jgi:deazaflavin-dependent oxidoreductase (nitroreductase family)
MSRAPSALRLLLLGTVLASAVLEGRAADAIPVGDQLLAVKHQGECRITTKGRKSGNPHSVPVWFAVEGDVLYLSTLDDTRDWVKNALANPAVTVAFGDLTVTGRFRDVTDTELDARVRDALRDKYWAAWVAGWFGQGPKRTFVIEDLEVVEPTRPTA